MRSPNSTDHERPRNEWIEIAVPAIIIEETFALVRSDCRPIKITRLVGQLHRACVVNAGTVFMARRRQQVRARFTTISVFGSDRQRQLTGAIVRQQARASGNS